MLAIMAMVYQPLRTSAQADFAPIGAKWYYSGGLVNSPVPGPRPVDGYVLQESVGDTLIQGITARKLQRTAFERSTQDNSIQSSAMSSVYVYATPDTVFHFDEQLARFLPLYIFNVQAGDTLAHRVPSEYANLTTDTIWKFLVDSVATVTYNNHPVKVVYNGFFPVDAPDPGGIPLAGPYYEYIGLIDGHLSEYGYPHPANAPYVDYYLRCYQDARFEINFGNPNKACDSLDMNPLSVTDADFFARNLSVYPNPVSDELHIALEGMTMQTVTVTDLLGRNVVQKAYPAGTSHANLNLSGMNKGTYILCVTSKEKGTVYRKISLR